MAIYYEYTVLGNHMLLAVLFEEDTGVKTFIPFIYISFDIKVIKVCLLF